MHSAPTWLLLFFFGSESVLSDLKIILNVVALLLGTLVSTAMFTTLHRAEDGKPTNENKPANGWTITRYKFFVGIHLFFFRPAPPFLSVFFGGGFYMFVEAELALR